MKIGRLNAFLLAAYADRRTSTTDYQIIGGLVQYGLGPWRPRDSYGVAVGATHVNPNISNAQILANALGVGPGYAQHNEYVAEAWYGWQTTLWLNLKLDAQYVINPGGYTKPDNRNAFVFGVEKDRLVVASASGGDAQGEAPSAVPKNLPFERAARTIAVIRLAGSRFYYDQGSPTR